MKILIPILGFGRAGGNRVLSEFANAWARRGHAVDFLCPDSSDDPYFPTSARVLWGDHAGNVSTARGEKPKPSGWHHLVALYRGIQRIGDQYDVILANHSLTAWPVALAHCSTARKIYYIQAYEPEYYWHLNSAKGYLLAFAAACTYHFRMKKVVNSPIYLRMRNLRASEVVPPGLDLAIFRPAKTTNDITSKENVVIGCIGRHEPEKGTNYVLSAFEELYRSDKRYRLRVAYGNLPEAWRHEMCEVVVPSDDNELADFYRSLDIIVAPGTVQHGAPHYPVLEGGACGAAVVTTGYLGATKDTAWLVKNRDPDSIVTAIRDIVANHEQLTTKRDAFLRVVQHFDWDIVADQMLQIFTKGH